MRKSPQEVDQEIESFLSTEMVLSLKRSVYTQSYYEFFKAFFSLISGGDEYNDNWHIEFICNRLQKELERIKERRVREKDLIINVPFRSSKSLMVTVAFPVWCWITRPQTKFICTSYSASLALEHADLARTLIGSELFQTLFGDKVKFIEDENQKGFYKIQGGGYRKSIGTMGQITGSGSDIIICLPLGQKILTDQGEIDIAEIVNKQLDLKIASLNVSTKQVEYHSIKRYDKNAGKRLIKIKTETSEITCTEDHEIWTQNRGYVKAKDLTLNDILLRK